MKKLAAALLATLCVAACQQQAAAPAPAPPPPPPPAAAAPPTAAQIAPGKWDVAHVKCSDLLHASDDDRASAVMFYYGYLAAQNGIRIIDVNKISDNIHKVMEQCGKTPDMTVTRAFHTALATKLGPHK